MTEIEKKGDALCKLSQYIIDENKTKHRVTYYVTSGKDGDFKIVINIEDKGKVVAKTGFTYSAKLKPVDFKIIFNEKLNELLNNYKPKLSLFGI